MSASPKSALRPDTTDVGNPETMCDFDGEVPAMLELQRAAVSDAVVSIQRPDGAPQDVRGERERAARGDELKVHASAGAQRTRRLHQRAAGTQIDERHGAARPQRRTGEARQRLGEPRVEPTIDYLPIHARSPVS